MAKNDLTAFSESMGIMTGQPHIASSGSPGTRIIYPAIVRNVDDKAAQNRIQVEIVSIDENGQVRKGKDANIPLAKLPICIPLVSEFVHVRPKVGEMVLVIVENPTDMTSPRYWIGPVRTSQITMDYQSYEETYNIFNRSSYRQGEIFGKPTLEKNSKIATIIPQPVEIAVQGRNDANITFKDREVVIRTGEFNKDTIDINTTHPCRIQLKQFDQAPSSTGALNNASFLPYSQTNIISTNINLISTEGQNRNVNVKTVETTTNQKNLDRYGDIAKQLHPLVFGDNLVDLLKIMLNFMLVHIHTPQNPPVAPLDGISQLSAYKTDDKIQEIISKNVRTN